MAVARVCWVSSRAGRPGDWRRMPRMSGLPREGASVRQSLDVNSSLPSWGTHFFQK